MFKGQPKGLFALALANTGERFGYYTMLAIFLLYLQAKFGFSASTAGQLYATFLAVVYFMPVVGGILADKIGFGKCVVTGVSVMFIGYLCLAIPTPASTFGLVLMILALVLIASGTGLFKGNLQVLVGNLYDDPKYSAKRDSAFSLFYMAINVGAMFAPTAATALTNWKLGSAGLFYKSDAPAIANQILTGDMSNLQIMQSYADSMSGAAGKSITEFCQYYIDNLSVAYNLGFGVACVSLIFSIAIYLGCRSWFKHADVKAGQAASSNAAAAVELTPKQTRDRIIALILVFAVVIFFWMAFHQNGSSLTYFARDYTQPFVTGPLKVGFNIWALALIAASIYTLFGAFQSETSRAKTICAVVTLALWGGAYLLYRGMDATRSILPQEFQQFNPFFVVALTPVSMALFGSLAKKGKEPSAPKKIGLGMFVAALGYAVMLLASTGQPTPASLNGAVSPDPVVPTYLISTYLVLTFAELLLSPMGISFVSKVAPPKYKGLMMGCWFAATAIGNYLSSIPSMLWDRVPLWLNWTILMALCVAAALIMFAMLKKIEAATQD